MKKKKIIKLTTNFIGALMIAFPLVTNAASFILVKEEENSISYLNIASISHLSIKKHNPTTIQIKYAENKINLPHDNEEKAKEQLNAFIKEIDKCIKNGKNNVNFVSLNEEGALSYVNVNSISSLSIKKHNPSAIHVIYADNRVNLKYSNEQEAAQKLQNLIKEINSCALAPEVKDNKKPLSKRKVKN